MSREEINDAATLGNGQGLFPSFVLDEFLFPFKRLCKMLEPGLKEGMGSKQDDRNYVEWSLAEPISLTVLPVCATHFFAGTVSRM